jgi:tetratricopeptide (TPR) repeat protein
MESVDRAIAIQPDFAKAYYNKAACYALEGQVKVAFENLEQAIKLNPNYRAVAQTDPDFEAIVKHQRFRQLLNGNGNGNGTNGKPPKPSPTPTVVRMTAQIQE